MKEAKKELFITHVFDALPAAVFAAWTDPAMLVQWYAPDGCSISFKSIHVAEGGNFHSCVHDPVHGDCWIIGNYLEVSPPQKLVFTMALSNEHGGLASAPEAGKPDDWPAEILTTVLFTSVGKQTKVSIHQTVSEEEARKTGAYQSWIKMLNKLNLLLHPIQYQPGDAQKL